MGAYNDLNQIYQSANPDISNAFHSARSPNRSDTKNKFDQWKAENEAAKQNAFLSSAYEQSNWENRFQSENERQNWLLQNQKAVEVSALRQAGLNPALAGGGVSPAPINNPSAGTPTATAPHFNPALSGQEMLLRGLEGAKGIAAEFTQWAKLPNEAKSAKAVAEFDKWHSKLQQKEVEFFDESRRAEIEKNKASASDYLQHARWLDYDVWKQQQRFVPEMKILAADYDLRMSQKELNQKQVEIGNKTLAKMDEEINLLKSEKLLTDNQSKEIIERIKNFEPMRDLMSAQRSYYLRTGYMNYQQGNLNHSQDEITKFTKKVLDEVGIDWKANQDKWLPYINAIGQYLNFSLSFTGMKKF